MRVIPTEISEVLLIEPRVFGDERGLFFESYNEQEWQRLTGRSERFVQDNHSRSVRGVLRGLHYQVHQPQGKLVRVVVGEVFDVAVDLRRTSPTFGKWVSAKLSAANRLQLWVPAGFAHGFLVLSEVAEFLYKTTDYYAPAFERSVLWKDPDLRIDWPLPFEPILSAKDKNAPLFREAEHYD